MLDKKDKRRIQTLIEFIEDIAKVYDSEGKMMPFVLYSTLEDLQDAIK